MGDAKQILLRPVTAREANALVRRVHYSGKVVKNSQIHVGVFYGGKSEGAMQFGPSLDKRKTQGLVAGTGWNEFIELNRMAFSDTLPRNSESRALGVAMRLLRKHAPQLKWVISFADGAQCGDGTIYRAAGFVLTAIKPNKSILELPDGFRFAGPTITGLGPKGGEKVRREIKRRVSALSVTKGTHIQDTGGASLAKYKEAGARFVDGYQLRYVYFLDPSARERLTAPVMPFSEIGRRGARMYRGRSLSAASIDGDAATNQVAEGGSIPTAALQ